MRFRFLIVRKLRFHTIINALRGCALGARVDGCRSNRASARECAKAHSFSQLFVKQGMEVKMTAEGMYTIKEAAKKVHVEAHALRYWEEELGLSISRNDQGYRQYSEEDMELLERIRQWKEKGMQLKAIRLMLSENGRLSVPQEIVREAQSMLEKGDAGAAAAQQEHAQCAFTSDNSDTLHSQHALTPGGADTVENILLDERSSKAAKLQYLLENLVSRAVQESNEMVLKELDYRFRQMEENAQEREQKRMEREEEHYRKLDELLCQKGRRKGRRRR